MDSIDYYERYASAYYENTVERSMEDMLARFLELLPENADVLDLGCGYGRDTVALEEAGCYVTPLDGSAQMCRLAEIETDKEVLHMTFAEMDFDEVFDGIWACASLLHVPSMEMDDIMRKVMNALVPGGILYMSFHYGEQEEYRNGRLFHDFTEESISEVLEKQADARILDLWVTEDVQGRDGNKWLNVLVRRLDKEEGGCEDE